MIPDLSPWGDVRDLTLVPGGARRRALRGILNGQPVIAKSNALPEPSLRWQLRIEAAARRAGFVTPGLLETRRGTLSAHGWTVEPFLTGCPATPADLRAAPFARFHAHAHRIPSRPGLRRRLPAKWDRLSRLPGPLGGLHGDLHPGNILRVSSGRLALLDWEEARRAPLAIDRAAPGSRDHLRAELAACAWPERARATAMARTLRRYPDRPRPRSA
ncbi:MAG: phosphotransferase [Pseudomonadota bacterium]